VGNFKNKLVKPLAKHVPVGNFKNKLVKPLAKHVPICWVTALLVRRVALIVVLLEPLQRFQHRVIHVLLDNTMNNEGNQVANSVMLGNTTTS